MDGFDVLSIAFASRVLRKSGASIAPPLGIVLSMELVGMAFGSVLLGGVADKVGRRPTLIGCLIVMAAA
ncbi:MAG: MFS transporter [Acidobacteriota bacterium]